MSKVVDFFTRQSVTSVVSNPWVDVHYGVYIVTLKDRYYGISTNRGIDIHEGQPGLSIKQRTYGGIYENSSQLDDEHMLLLVAPAFTVSIPHKSIESILRIHDIPWKRSNK